MPTPAAGRVKNLTLKEQSSLIDKLQKDNWKLKLKLYYLDQMVAERSDEAVKAMISENVDLKTHKFGTAKELRNLKRTIRELEYKVKEREETIATLKSNANERTNKASSGTEDVQELVTEVTFLRERVEEYELEIEKLQNEGLAKDGEKRRLAQVVKSISERKATESDIGVREEVVC
jgi:septal ring factor EnvC (AmiA/AmiB activator)